MIPASASIKTPGIPELSVPAPSTIVGPEGTTTLTFANPREADNRVVFDLQYEYTNEATRRTAYRDLGQLGAAGVAFIIDTNFWAEPTPDGGNIIAVRQEELDTPEGLFSVLHEVAHTKQWPLVNNAIAHAVLGEELRPNALRALQAYGPVLRMLTKYATTHPGFTQETIDVVTAWRAKIGPKSPWALDAMLPEDEYLVHAPRHNEAFRLISALCEAYAWYEAIHMVEREHLRPTMGSTGMRNYAQEHVGPYASTGDAHRLALWWIFKNNPSFLNISLD